MSHPEFGAKTTAEEAAAAFSEQIKGKTILITGVSPGGIGLVTAQAIAAHSPALIILATRSQSALDAAASTIRETSPDASLKKLLLDLGSIATARKAAEEVLSWSDVPKIDVLINNAGVMSCPFELSEDGIERQFSTNHIGPFVITMVLLPKIIAAKGRIINLSSAGHRFGPVRFDDINFGNGKSYDADQAYGQSKTANILFSISLARKLSSYGITSFSVHPGRIPTTNLPRHMDVKLLQERGMMDEKGHWNQDFSMTFKTVSQGSSSTIVAAFDEGLVGENGKYLADCKVEEVMEYAGSEENAEKLWRLSEELVGERFEY